MIGLFIIRPDDILIIACGGLVRWARDELRRHHAKRPLSVIIKPVGLIKKSGLHVSAVPLVGKDELQPTAYGNTISVVAAPAGRRGVAAPAAVCAVGLCRIIKLRLRVGAVDIVIVTAGVQVMGIKISVRRENGYGRCIIKNAGIIKQRAHGNAFIFSV